MWLRFFVPGRTDRGPPADSRRLWEWRFLIRSAAGGFPDAKQLLILPAVLQPLLEHLAQDLASVGLAAAHCHGALERLLPESLLLLGCDRELPFHMITEINDRDPGSEQVRFSEQLSAILVGRGLDQGKSGRSGLSRQ